MKVGDRRVGTTVAGRFQIESLIGEGQMAHVYVAQQISMKRRVALKIMHHDLLLHKAAPTRFRREVEAVTRLRSPHSIVFYDFGSTDDGSLFFAMEMPVITSPSVTVGTPAYLPPEMAISGRRADLRGDLYSLGVMVFEMLT